jgi:hypothetical protein
VFDVIVRPLFRSLSSPLFRALTGLVSAVTKVLIDLSPTSSSFYSLGTDSVLATAYKLGISTVLPTASTTYALYGRASSATDYLKILSTGYLSLDVDGTVVTSTVLATKDSRYREYSVTLGGNDFIFKENDTVISTVTNATASAKTLTLNLIGNSNSANFYLGVLADAVMGSITFPLSNLTENSEVAGGVTLTYQNIGTGRSFRETYTLIDDDYFGSERIVGGDFLNPSDWSTAGESTVSGGRANIFSTTGSNTYVFQSDVMDEDKFFRIIYNVFSYTSGVLRMSAVSGSSVSSDVGTTTIDFIALGTSILLQRASVEPTNIVIDSISIKRYIEVA